ncbi:fibroblast growth factor receptor substrate 2 [Copidosoma floridanum]|uniref:fibroblast growth factor receptor substrate 2 n=1 Tax=Copidosoma floridanum TaxID=29053 RepID=UPI0006C98514|nr:fibroblast growth factor receptor substrate 2 [Copidosoma floridanum]
MGCAYSQSTCDHRASKIFEALNIDSAGNGVTDGTIKVTKADISFRYNNKLAVWPLRSLRRYGYDEQIFSFEAGRRCQSGPGIYAFKCEKADQLFYLVQQNILADKDDRNSVDRVPRDMSNDINSCRPITRMTIIPTESNYLEPTPAARNISTFPHSHNGRIGSVGSSSGPISPQGTMGTPSPPPLSLPPPPNVHPSLYANEEAAQTISPGDPEHNNNKSLGRRSMQRSQTVSSSTSSSVFLSSEQVSSGQPAGNEVWATSQGGAAVPSQPSYVPSYMNVDLGSDASPLSPSSTCDSSTPQRKNESSDSLLEIADSSYPRVYANVSPEPEKVELVLPVAANNNKPRPPALPILPLQLEPDEDARHSYANLGNSEIEALKKRYSVVSMSERLSGQVQTPPPYPSGFREMKYAVLNLDRKEVPSLWLATTPVKTSTSAQGTPTTGEPTTLDPHASSPDLTSRTRPQNGYVTIDFDKTNALLHSSNTNNKSCEYIPDEGSRKTRHNSTIGELMAS